MANIEDGVEEKAEVGDGTEIEADPKADKTQPIEGGETDPNRGTEDRADEGSRGEDGEEVLEEEEGAESEPGIDERIEKLEAKWEEKLKSVQPPADQPRELSEEQWVEHEQRYGVPRQTIKAFTEQTVRAMNALRTEFRQMFQQEVGGFKKDSAISRLAKEPGFADAPSLRTGIDKFLEKFDASHHSNPDLLKTAVIFARGLKSASNVTRARTTDEKNRKVMTRLKTGRPEVGVRTKSSKPLSEMERQAAEIMGDEAEYSKFKNPASRIIAA